MKVVNKVSEELYNFLNLTNSFPLSRLYFIAVFSFRILAKNNKELHLAHGNEYLTDFLLRFTALTFTQVLYYWRCFALGFRFLV